jgi:hypothetical protein
VHPVGELAGDRQAEAGPLGFVVGGEEGLEDVRHVLSLDAEAAVGDLQPHVPVGAGGRNTDARPLRRVHERVVQEDT